MLVELGCISTVYKYSNYGILLKVEVLSMY